MILLEAIVEIAVCPMPHAAAELRLDAVTRLSTETRLSNREYERRRILGCRSHDFAFLYGSYVISGGADPP